MSESPMTQSKDELDVQRLVTELEFIRKEQNIEEDVLARLSGISINTMGSWNDKGTVPRIGTMSKVLNVLGYELIIAKQGMEE